jgi:hypothetical protein
MHGVQLFMSSLLAIPCQIRHGILSDDEQAVTAFLHIKIGHFLCWIPVGFLVVEESSKICH